MPNQSDFNRWQRISRARKKKNGECIDCKNSVEFGKSRCTHHLRVMALNATLFRERLKEKRQQIAELKYDNYPKWQSRILSTNRADGRNSQ